MATQRTFGHRTGPQPQAPQVKPRPPANLSKNKITDIEPATASLNPLPSEGPSIDDELREWKQARKKTFQIPWRQLSVMAGLCFGIASFVLPDSVSDNLQWLLYALAAASFYAGFRRRKNALI
jgi:hypothetical protein